MSLEKRRICTKTFQNLKEYHKLFDYYHGFNDKKQEELYAEIEERYKNGEKELRSFDNIESVYYSLMGKDDRIIPLGFKMKSGERFTILNCYFDEKRKDKCYRKAPNLTETIKYYPVCNNRGFEETDFYFEFSRKDIERLPGYEEFSKNHRDLDGRLFKSWNDVKFVVWESCSTIFVEPDEIFLKDGTSLSIMCNDIGGLDLYMDDGGRYAVILDSRESRDFPMFEELFEKLKKGIPLKYEVCSDKNIHPFSSQVFTHEYMLRKEYLPDVLKKTEDGKYVVSCLTSDLTEETLKRIYDKGVKIDRDGRVVFSMSHDVLVGDVMRHLQMSLYDGKIDKNFLDGLKEADLENVDDIAFIELLVPASYRLTALISDGNYEFLNDEYKRKGMEYKDNKFNALLEANGLSRTEYDMLIESISNGETEDERLFGKSEECRREVSSSMEM